MAKRSAKCPQCGNRVELDAQAGGHVVCPQCQAQLTVNIHKTGEPDTPAAPADPLIGQTLGEFEIVDLLGRGGMGAVYKARQPSLGRMVAVKVLSKVHSRDAAYVGRFTREARAAAAVSHSSIIEIHSVGSDRGHHYIAMELVEGETLGDVLRRDGPVSPDRAVEIMKHVAAALAEAHGAGIVHRDIKPSNILLTPRGGVKVADFGLAKRPETDVAVTHAGKILGTPLYMAPEVASGEAFEPRSDLYSLGATFYHALAGRPPFQGSTGSEIAVKQVKEEVPPLAEVAPNVPSVLARLIHRLLCKDPADRHATAAAVVDALQYIDADMAAAKSPSGLGTALPPAQRRVLRKIPTAKSSNRPKLLIGGIIAAAVLAVGIGIVLIFALGGDDPAGEQGKPPSTAKPSPPPSSKKPPAWQADWQAAKAKADRLAKAEKFGEALAVYQTLGAADDDPDLGEEIYRSTTVLHGQAAAAWRRVRDEAQSLIDQKKYDGAAAALRPALEVFGVAEHTQQARTMLAKIVAARMPAKPTTRPVVVKPKPPDPTTQPVVVKPTPKTRPAPATQPKPSPADDLRRKRDAQYAQALKPVEALVAAWNFRGAEAALAKLKFEDKELTQRLATRRDEVARLAKLKAKITAQVNRTKPWLRKGQAVVPGTGGKKLKTTGEQIASADENGVTLRDVKAVGEKSRRQTWAELDKRVLPKLLVLAVAADNADDQLAAGLLALVRKDAATAEKHFDKARELGVKIDRYLGPLAAGALAKATALLDAKKYAEADEVLAALEKKYGKTPWFASHKDEFASVRTRVRSAVAEAQAEKLYAQAVKLFEKKAVWDLKPLVEKLKADYAKTGPVTDTKRTPSFEEMAKALEGLGKFLTVRQDGKGEFKTIQAAIDAAPMNSLIEIQDSATYSGKPSVGNTTLTIRGREGCWPIISSTGPQRSSDALLTIRQGNVMLERLVLAYSRPWDTIGVGTRGGGLRSLRLRSVIAAGGCSVYVQFDALGRVEADNCLFFGMVRVSAHRAGAEATLRNCPWVTNVRLSGDVSSCKLENVVCGGNLSVLTSKECRIRSCTILGPVQVRSGDTSVLNSIAQTLESSAAGTQIDHTNAFGKLPFLDKARPGKRCFRGDPQFRDPKNLDYRLRKTSPGCGNAADGGDVGVRYTPGMIEIVKKALELRKKGIIKF